MKKNRFFLFGFISFVCILLTSCVNQTESFTNIDVSIDGKPVDQVALSLNSLMSYEFTVQASEKVGRMELLKTVNGINSNIAVISSSRGS